LRLEIFQKSPGKPSKSPNESCEITQFLGFYKEPSNSDELPYGDRLWFFTVVGFS